MKKKKLLVMVFLFGFFGFATALVLRQPSQEIRSHAAINLPLIPWAGGPAYYAKFTGGQQWNNPNFFPIGVWFESVLNQGDIDKDKAAGLNTYIVLTNNSDMTLIRNGGMFALGGPVNKAGTETMGYALGDEIDMNLGPGNGAWTGSIEWGEGCTAHQGGNGDCGYTAMQGLLNRVPKDGKMTYANYGKGVAYWESDSQAAPFVNNYTSFVSDDIYWYTDPGGACSSGEGGNIGVTQATCRRSSNYGLVIDKMRRLDALDGKLQPIWGFVEDGHPFTEDNAPTITGPQLQGAVMNSLIHEARGIIYFNHNFGGPCESQHVLRDCGTTTIRPFVTTINGIIKALAPVLNTQSYQYSFNASLDTMLKVHSGAYYIFAMQKSPKTSGSYAFTLPAGMTGTSVEVLNENRTVPISGGKFTDSFAAEYSYHIYKIGGATTTNPTNTTVPQGPSNTPTKTPTTSPAPSGSTKLKLDLLLHGIGKAGDSVLPGEAGGGNSNLVHLQRAVRVEISNGNDEVIASNNNGLVVFDPQSGSFKGTIDMGETIPTSGTYGLRVKFSQSLKQFRPQTITIGTTIQVPQMTLINGDINDDNSVSINLSDYNILLGCYSDFTPAADCDPTRKVMADINDDGSVNFADLNLFLRELSSRLGDSGGTDTGNPVTPGPVTGGVPTNTPTRTPTPTNRPTTTVTSTPPTGQFLPPAATGKTWQLSFAEEFNGTDYDHSKLTPCFDWNSGGCTSSFNKGREHYLPSQVRVSGGTAKLVAEPLSPAYSDSACLNGSCTYKSGLLSTARANASNPSYLYTYTYGYLESRFKFPAIQGFFTAFWMLPADKSYNYRSEIDILELLGHDPTDMEMHYSYNNRSQSYSPNFNPNKNGACPDKNYSTDFHNIGLDWQPDHIAWYIDGVKCAQFTNASQIENGPMQIILDLMIDHEWQRNVGKTLQNLSAVGQLEVDYIRVFQQR